MTVVIEHLRDLDMLIAEHWFNWCIFEQTSDVSDILFWCGRRPGSENPEPIPPYTSERWAAYDLEQKMTEAGWIVSAKIRPNQFPFILQSPDGQKKIYTKTVCELQWMKQADECPSFTTHPVYFHDDVCVAIAMAALFAKNIQAVLKLEIES